MVRDSVTHLRGRGPAGLPRRRALLRRLRQRPGVRRSRCCASAAEAGADVAVLCDTNGGRLPDEVADVVHAVRAATCARLGHPLPQRRRLRGGQLAGRRRRRRHPRAGHAQRLRRAHRQRRHPHGRRQPRAQAGPSGAARGPAAGGDPGRARGVRARQRAAVQPAAVRRGVGVRAQGRPARQRGPGRPDALPARGAGARSATTCGCWSPTWPAGPSIELKGRELGYDLSGNDELLGRVTAKVKDLESRGYTFEAADASFELLLRAEVEGGRPDFFEVESWRVIVDAHADRRRRQRRDRRRGDRQAAGRRRAAGGGRARATARSTRSTTRCAARSRTPTRS